MPLPRITVFRTLFQKTIRRIEYDFLFCDSLHYTQQFQAIILTQVLNKIHGHDAIETLLRKTYPDIHCVHDVYIVIHSRFFRLVGTRFIDVHPYCIGHPPDTLKGTEIRMYTTPEFKNTVHTLQFFMHIGRKMIVSSRTRHYGCLKKDFL